MLYFDLGKSRTFHNHFSGKIMKFFKIFIFLSGFLGVMLGVVSLSFDSAENTRDFAFRMMALGLMLLIVSVFIAVEHQGEKTRRLLRKIHGLEKEAGEED